MFHPNHRRMWASLLLITAVLLITGPDLNRMILAQGDVTATPNINWVSEPAGVNVRSGPGLEYNLVGALAVGSWVQPLARDITGEWVLISYLYTQGWIQVNGISWRLNTAALPVIEEMTPIPRPLYYNTPGGPTYTPNANWVQAGIEGAYIRSGPGQGFPPLGVVHTGDVLDPVAHDQALDWVLVRYGEGYGWIRYDLVAWVEVINSLPVIDVPELTPDFTPVPARPTITPTGSPTRPSLPMTQEASLIRTPTPEPTLTPTPSYTPTDTATPTVTRTASITPSETPTLTATATETASPTLTTTASPSATFTTTYTATFTETAAATITPPPSETASPEPSLTTVPLTVEAAPMLVTWTALPSATLVASATTLPTETPIPTATAIESPIPTLTATETAISNPTETPAVTLSPTPTVTLLAVAAADNSIPTGAVSETTPSNAAQTAQETESSGRSVIYFVLAGLALAALVYASSYVVQAANIARYHEGFILSICPVCTHGSLFVEDRRYRILGIPRVRRVVRCDS
ncbi:MAG: hypothetical protein HY866_20920, partial [Chloroflexi bacterium]|nr:hypothetical protein [Chloroflexota bacterium]